MKANPLERTVSLVLKPRPADCQIKLSDGTELGRVQSVTVHAQVEKPTTATIHTACTEAEAEILQKNTRLHISIHRDYTFYQNEPLRLRLKSAWKIIKGKS